MDVYHRERSVKEGHRLLAQASVMIIRLMAIVILNCVASWFVQSKNETKNKQQQQNTEHIHVFLHS